MAEARTLYIGTIQSHPRQSAYALIGNSQKPETTVKPNKIKGFSGRKSYQKLPKPKLP